MRDAAGQLADRLHLLRLAQLALELAALAFGLAARGDVAQMADVDVAVGRRRDADRELDRELAAVGAHRGRLDESPHERPFAGMGEPAQAFVVAGTQVLGNDHVGEEAAEHRRSRVAEAALGGGVELDDAPFAVHADDAVERRLDGRAQARLAALQLALALAPLGDVAHHREHVRLAAVADRDDAQVGLEAGPVGPQRDRLDARLLAAQRALDALAPLGDVAGRERLG